MKNFLLIDDDVLEYELMENLLSSIYADDYRLVFMETVKEAIGTLVSKPYDMIFLDNRLTNSITSQFTVPFVKLYARDTPLVIISNYIDVPYLASPDILGVDDIVDKKDLAGFLKDLKFKDQQPKTMAG